MPPATTSAQALGNLQTAQGQVQSPDQLLSSQEGALGVPQQQQQVSGLRQAITNTTNLLNQVAPSVYGRTQNSLVTDAQATKQIGNEQAPIQTKLSGLNTSEANAASDLSTNTGRAATLAGLAAQGQTDKLANLKDIYTALYGQEQDASKAAETKREFDASQASKGPSATDLKYAQSLADQHTLQTGVQSMTQALSKVTGKDGYVSPNDYNAAKRAWAAQGLDPAQFDQYLAGFRNPGNPYYGVSNSTSGLSSLLSTGAIGQ